MWSNLRDVAGKITSVVAPPLTTEENDDDEEEEYDEEEDEEEYYDDDAEEEAVEEEESERQQEKDYSSKVGIKSPFGFVDLITRAMDQNEQDQQHLHQESEESYLQNNYNNKPQSYMSNMVDVLSEDGGNDIHQRYDNNDKNFYSNSSSMKHHIEIQSDDEDDIDFGYPTTTATQHTAPSSNIQNNNHDTDNNINNKNSSSNHPMADEVPIDQKPPLPPPPLFVDVSSSSRMTDQVPVQPPLQSQSHQPSTEEEPPMSPYQRRKHLPRDDSMDYEYEPPTGLRDSSQMRKYMQNQMSTQTTTTPMELSPTEHYPPDQDSSLVDHNSPVEPPIRFSLVRESGSVSPQRTSTKKMILGNSHWDQPPMLNDGVSASSTSSISSNQYTNNNTNISSRSLGSTPCGKQVLLSPLRDILHSEQQEQERKDKFMNHNVTYTSNIDNGHTANTDTTTGNNSTIARQFPRDALLGSFSVPNDADDIALLVENEHEEAEDEAEEKLQQLPSLVSSNQSSIVYESTTSSAGNTNTNNNTKKLNRADSGQLPAAKHRGSQTRIGRSSLPTISLESFDENDDVDHSNADSSVSTSRNRQEAILSEQQIRNDNSTEVTESKIIQTDEQVETIKSLELKCKELQANLMNAESQIAELLKKDHPKPVSNHNEPTNVEYEALMIQFQEKETRLLQAANEEHQHEIQNVRYEMNQQIFTLQQQLLDERNAFVKERDQFESQIVEYIGAVEKLQSQSRIDQEKHEKVVEQMQQQHARALRKVEDKLAQTVASLEDRDNDTKRYRDRIKQLESKLSEQNKGVNEVEEEVNELHNENEILHDHIERLQAEAVELRNTITKLEGDSEKLVHLKMELRMLKEDHSREKAKIQTVAASAESSTAQLEAERDEALAKIHDLQIQLSAAFADFDVAKSDAERIMQANANLQAALEAFQNERDSEMAMVEENQREREKALAAKHAAILDATHEANMAEIRQIQQVSDAALMNSMEEIKKLEDKLETYRVENIQTRRSLDEAIKRLQATQDDVIDRTFMKNILLDWLTKNDRKEKVQVLEIMASVLHFTEAEKEKVHIDDGSGGSFRKLVIPPPPKVDLEALEGDNVREKWVNFLIAEAED